MITGVVTSNLEAVIRLIVRGQERHVQEVGAIIGRPLTQPSPRERPEGRRPTARALPPLLLQVG